MRVLIIGSGGREHALAWQAARSARVDEVLVAPGNGGTASERKTRNVAVDAGDIDGLLRLAREAAVDVTIVGPEAPLVAGVVDRFREAGLDCFGPPAAAARLEGSKAWAKAFMQRHRIPTADSESFTALAPALEWIRAQRGPLVVKASGLAAGKGVVMAGTPAEAEEAARDMLAGDRFGDAGSEIVVEQCLQGEETSYIVAARGRSYLAFPSSQDHKRRDDGDHGPNTGGMGAYSPAPLVDPELQHRIETEVIEPALAGLEAEGMPYSGFLYAGLMIDTEGNPRVLEFNCRMGDPETQPLLLRLRSDLMDIIEAGLHGDPAALAPAWDERFALGVVLAAAGYPGSYPRDMIIRGIPEPDAERMVFHAGTRLDGDVLRTSGGRVLCATALGTTLDEAADKAYQLADAIDFEHAHYRRDIGARAQAPS